MQTREYREGYRAFLSKNNCCPYAIGTWQYKHWWTGNQQALIVSRETRDEGRFR